MARAPMTPVIRVSAAVVVDENGRALLVRKRGTQAFMHPGGKPEPGERPDETLVRELAEELGAVVAVTDLRPLGTFEADAANEPGHRVVADVFAVDVDPAVVTPAAEIAEALWVTAAEASALPLAPLARDALLPLVWP